MRTNGHSSLLARTTASGSVLADISLAATFGELEPKTPQYRVPDKVIGRTQRSVIHDGLGDVALGQVAFLMVPTF
jgi:hypothetical protein